LLIENNPIIYLFGIALLEMILLPISAICSPTSICERMPYTLRIPVMSSTESGHAVQWWREATLVREL